MFCFKNIKPYKYKLTRELDRQTDITGFIVDTPFIKLNPQGLITISALYAWDGPSGPAIDTDNFMRGSLLHDAIYQLIRTNQLPKPYRLNADRLLRDVCLEDGMFKWRAAWVYLFVRIVGDMAIKPFDEIRERCL